MATFLFKFISQIKLQISNILRVVHYWECIHNLNEKNQYCQLFVFFWLPQIVIHNDTQKYLCRLSYYTLITYIILHRNLKTSYELWCVCQKYIYIFMCSYVLYNCTLLFRCFFCVLFNLSFDVLKGKLWDVPWL